MCVSPLFVWGFCPLYISTVLYSWVGALYIVEATVFNEEVSTLNKTLEIKNIVSGLMTVIF